MKNLENMLKNFDLNSNATLMVVLGLGLILYTSVAAPKAPRVVTKYLDNTFLKLALILLIAYVASKDAPLAIVAAIALLVTLQTGANQSNAVNEKFSNNEQTQQIMLPASGLVANGTNNGYSNVVSTTVSGLDENKNASFNPTNEETLAEQTSQEIPKGIPSYVVESVSLYQPSNNELLSVGDTCGSDKFTNLNGSANNEAGLLDNNRPDNKNCSGPTDLSNVASGYGGLELAEF